MFEISNAADESGARLMVIGVGGAGNNAVNRMIDENIEGVEFVAVNTDKQDLNNNKATTTITIGEKLTGGLGAGANPEVGEKAAEESLEEINSIIKGVDMLFITAGMGGGTGTGASPVIAKAAREQGILTVAVVTKPFGFEQKTRMQRAIEGIDKLIENVDTLIVIPNEKIMMIIDSKTGFDEAFQMVDNVLQRCVRGITELITNNGVMNLDFADVQTVMTNQGYAHMGYGEGKGDNKCMDAVKMAVESPLLETRLDGAKQVILNFTGDNIGVMETQEAAEYVNGFAGEDVDVFFGFIQDDSITDEVKVTLIATGIDVIQGQNVSAFSKRSSSGMSPSMGNLGLKYSAPTAKPATHAPNLTSKPTATPSVAPKTVAPVKPVTPQVSSLKPQANDKPNGAIDIVVPDFLTGNKNN